MQGTEIMMSKETYREQIGRLIGAMSMPNREESLQRNLAPKSPLSRVKMFVDGNLEKRLDDKQQDYVTCQQARQTIENLARENRLKHVRFQELASLTQQHCTELETNRSLQVYINPIRTWARFVSSELLEDQTEPPVDVLFFAAGDQVATCVLELEGQALINELTDYQPCQLDDWSDWSSLADRQQLVELCYDLSEMGLVAFG